MHTHYEADEMARIKVISAGEAGDRIAATLGKLVANIECLPDSMPLRDVARSAAESDMVIIVSGLENEAATRRAADIAAMARRSESCQLALALVTKSSVAQYGPAQERFKILQCEIDALFLVRRDFMVVIDETAPEVITTSALEEYLVRLVAAGIIEMIIERGIICIDFADVKAILRDGGSHACLGIGIANGEDAASEAAGRALQAIRRQRMDPKKGGAFLVSVTGSTNMTMDDFDSASKVIHAAIDADANVIIGVLIDDALAGNIRVVIMAKRGFAALLPCGG